MATRPPHCGDDRDVPPMSYHPVGPTLLVVPSGGSDKYTKPPVAELACRAISGTPRCVAIAVLPAGNEFWYCGRENTRLKPPPEKVQATSAKIPPGLKGLVLEHFAPTPAAA